MAIQPTIEMANLGMADSLILMVMALVVFGPRRLPQIGRQIGKLMYEFRKASNDFKFQMEEELRSAEEADRRKKEEDRQKQLTLAAPAPVAATIEPVAAEPETGTGELPYLPMTTPEAQAEDATLRIQPPSTGEQVAANPPNTLAALVEAADKARAEEEAAKAAEETQKATEQVPQNG